MTNSPFDYLFDVFVAGVVLWRIIYISAHFSSREVWTGNNLQYYATIFAYGAIAGGVIGTSFNFVYGQHLLMIGIMLLIYGRRKWFI